MRRSCLGRRYLFLALLVVIGNGIALPGEIEKDSEIYTQASTPESDSRHIIENTQEILQEDISTDIAENVAELDVELDRSHSKEVQDSDGGQRQNYAAKDSGASILDHAPGTKGSVNLLVPDKDRYMLIPCANDKKWVVISLPEDIHADAIAIANYEKFSSPMKEFLVLGSINYPSETWYVLGNFTAANKNGEQLFEFNEKHHVRYIKLRMMSHYGSEYYCTMSQVKVYGRTFTQVISQLEKSIEAESTASNTLHELVTTASPSDEAERGDGDVCPSPHFENIFLAANPAVVALSSNHSMSCLQPEHDVKTNITRNGNTTSPTSTAIVDKTNATKPRNPSENDAKPNVSITSTSLPPPEEIKQPVVNGGNGLDNFYIRMSKKVQMLEVNLTHAEKSLMEMHRIHAHENERMDTRLQRLQSDLDELKTLMDKEIRFLSHSSDEYAALLNSVHQENLALRVEVQLMWDVIRTMKAGIMVAIILSAAMLVFFLCRWFFRCLTACHRRAARREWFRRLDAADLGPSDDEDDDIDPLTQRMTHRVDRNMRFGISYDDGAIQRNTLYRRIVNGFRQHHVQSKGQFSSNPTMKSRRSFIASKGGYSLTIYPTRSRTAPS